MDFDLPSVSSFSETLGPRSSKIKKPRKPPTACEICLGKATGHHYDVASCNGCKSFFRRVVTEKLKYTCKFKNECLENWEPEEPFPKCRACRFKKCIDVGMNPLGIESQLKQELEKEKMEPIEKPRATIESQVEDLIDKMIRLDTQSEKFRDCSYNPNRYPSLQEYLKQKSCLLSMADRYGPMQGWPLSKHTIEEHFKVRVRGKMHHPLMKRWLIFELVTQIELVKALPFFSDLSESDRYYLIQDTVLMSSNLTKAFYSYEQKSDRLIRPDGARYMSEPMSEELQSCLQDDIGMRCLRAILRNGIDRVEFVLLRALVLSNSGASEISELARKYLTKERQKYNLALFRYIMAKHGASGPARYANILGFIDILEHQQRDHRDVNMLVNLARKDRYAVPIFDEIMKDSIR